MAYPRKQLRWPGHVVGWGLFFFIGLPWSMLFLLGERSCDMHIGPPCAIGWGVTKLINFLIVLAVCAGAGWATNKAANALRRSDDGDEAE